MFKIRAIFVHVERFPTKLWESRIVIGHIISAIFSWHTVAATTTVQDENAIDLKIVEEAQSQATPLNQPAFVDQ